MTVLAFFSEVLWGCRHVKDGYACGVTGIGLLEGTILACILVTIAVGVWRR